MANHFSILAWRIPWTEEPGGLQLRSQRVAKSLTLVKQFNTQSSSEGVDWRGCWYSVAPPGGYATSTDIPQSVLGVGDGEMTCTPVEMTTAHLPQPFPWAWSNYMWSDVHI